MLGGVGHRRVARRDSTVPREQPSRFKGCGTLVATNWDILLRPDVGEGRNTMLRGGWCASSVSESVHGRLGFSRVIEEQSERQHRWGEERRVSCGPATPCHVRKMAVLDAYGDVLVSSSEWPILVPFILSQNELALRPLCNGGDTRHN